ncbi:MAG: ABC transporter permease [Trueperaceae bacterium]|nr:ABC transporter permease [Trueperaceae bacterium]MCO5173571.1 ABC transporter permease [Trueperaceae bacterium]MCW5818559.1 ABC transporter permease [Trueperaceae bacterium]
MVAYLLRRLVSLLSILVVVGLVVFFLVRLVPGDPTSALLGENATAEQVEALRTRLGLDRTLLAQFGAWMESVARGDLGMSIYMRIPVVTAVIQRIEPTGMLALAATLVAVLLGVSLGVIAAIKHNTGVDYAVMVIAMLGLSLPTFWLGLLMIMLFAVTLQWLPAAGYVSILQEPVASLRYLLMPALALGFSQAAIIARMTRASVLDTLGEDYVRTAHGKGLPASRVVIGHALRNAILPIVTVIGLSIATLAGGVVVTETVFNIPGAGRLVIDSVLRRDYPVIQGSVLMVAFVYAFVNLLVDLSYAFFDPRIRYQ